MSDKTREEFSQWASSPELSQSILRVANDTGAGSTATTANQIVELMEKSWQAALSQQEVVAWILSSDSDVALLSSDKKEVNERVESGYSCQPLYTAPPSTAQDGMVNGDKINEAILAAVAALYFDDSSDYCAALWEVLEHLSPEMWELLENDPAAAYGKAVAATKAAKGE